MGITTQIQRYISILLALTLLMSVFAITGMQKANAELSSSPIADFPQVVGAVYAVESAQDGSVFVAGKFSSVGGIERTNLAKILPDGTVDQDFSPNPNSAEYDEDDEVWYDSSIISALSYDETNDVLYIGGNFVTIGDEVSRLGLAGVDGTTGAVTDFDATINSGVQTLEVTQDGTALYAGGGFTVVNTDVVRREVAMFDTATSEATAFDADVTSVSCSAGDDTVYALHHDAANNHLYIAGRVFSLDGVERRGLARVDADTGALDTDFNPNIRDTNNTPSECSTVYSMAVSDDAVYVGGSLNRVNGTIERQNLTAVSKTTGNALPLNLAVNGTVYALQHNKAANSLYVGGGFTSVGGVSRSELAEINLTANEVSDFNPNITTQEVERTVYAIALSVQGTVYAGGSFDLVGGASRTSLAAFLNPDQDNDGIPSATENAAPNNGDANNDGTSDSQQSHVTSLVNEETGEYVTVVTPSGTTLETTTAEAAPNEDGFMHLFGLTGFTVSGVTPGDTIPIEIFYPNPDNLSPTTLTPKKYFPSTQTYQDLPGTTLTKETIDSQATLKLSYQLTDGGDYDLDETADGSITDPVSLAMSGSDVESLADTGANTQLIILLAAILLTTGLYQIRKTHTL
jgi:hypothetical protein